MRIVAEGFEYKFEWDPVKARQNLREHRVSFERAATVFVDPKALSEADQEHGEEEDRWVFGFGSHRCCWSSAILSAKKGSQARARLRLISARKANKNEAKQYERK